MIAAVLSVGAFTGGINLSPVAAPEDCNNSLGEPLVNGDFTASVLTYQEQLCVSLGSGVVTYTEWADGITPTSRPATAVETDVWNKHVAELIAAAELKTALASLAADVEPGKKLVEILREWSVQGLQAYDEWPTKTAAQKDAANRLDIRRTALLFGKVADWYTATEGR